MPDPMTSAHPMSAEKCTATSKRTHVRCGAWRSPGATVCQWHGAKAPQVQKKARERILESADAVAAVLVTMALSDLTPDAVRLAAARDLLDRAGEGATRKLEVEHHDGDLADLDAAARRWAAAQTGAGSDQLAGDRPA